MDTITIDALGKGGIIDRNIFGHFSEHLGRCIYGGYWVGEDYEVPNTRGIRTDVVEALKRSGIPNLRWPGGCFADEYHWMDGIGPRANRPSMVNTHWGGVTEDNSFGTHEFMDLCEQLACEPYICGNVGSGSVQEMAQWVEYLTSDARSPMTDLRRENGREDPWRVRLWGVGNENWGCGGNMTPEYYANVYRRFAGYCRDYGDNRLSRIACGPNGNDYRWTEELMRSMCRSGYDRPGTPSRFMQGLSLHYYTTMNDAEGKSYRATGFGRGEWFHILRKALRMDELIRGHRLIMDRYDPQESVALVVDEWGTWYAVEEGTNPRFLYQQNSLRDALVASVTLDTFIRHCSRVRVANLAQTVNVLQAMVLTTDRDILLTPTFHVFEMYRVHQQAARLPLRVECGEFDHEGDALPRLSASASRGEETIGLTISNLDPDASAAVAINLRGVAPDIVSARVLTADGVDAHNSFERPEAVVPSELGGCAVDGSVVTAELPPGCVAALSLRPR